MTRQQAQRMLPVIEAFAKGLQVRMRPSGSVVWQSVQDFLDVEDATSDFTYIGQVINQTRPA